ncbi:helix-turn-helix domain-containing protein [Streptosporangium saharense]|uniref:Transcriptional regulator with XRE-family HTH domain n=1 Tax=Streptosporangium saharense TaxID=1706840 RepID=A0A7W7VKU4_9ACTN|nr:helix-turn-helix transcriptional regulator [Streptosporangium saharense]MBB4914071.1 transcriptional regulator with XRE-family HTH domain [Streptosporangium saharense]
MGTESQEWHEFGRALRKWRNGHQVTQRQLGELIGWADSMVSRWESGILTPSAEAIETLDATLNAEGKLISLGLHAAVADSNRLRKGTVEAKASTRDEDEDMDRRRLMRDAAAVAVGGAVAPVLATLTDAWQSYGPRISGASVSQEMIDDWEEAAEAHWERGYYDSPAVLLAALAVDYANLAPHLNRAQPEAVERNLSHAAARFSALIAAAWYDLDNHREASRWWKRTRTLADVSRDSTQSSLVRSWEASRRRHDSNDVLPLLQEARRLAGDQPSVTLFSALRVEVQALATQGRTEEAITALNRAENVLEALPAQTPGIRPDWYSRSLVYTLAGDDRKAEEAREAAGKIYDATHIMSTVLELHRAATQARTDPEQGVRHALSTLNGIPTERRDRQTISSARLVLTTLPEKAGALPAVRELRALTTGRSA